jgi:hypothetical protein
MKLSRYYIGALLLVSLALCNQNAKAEDYNGYPGQPGYTTIRPTNPPLSSSYQSAPSYYQTTHPIRAEAPAADAAAPQAPKTDSSQISDAAVTPIQAPKPTDVAGNTNAQAAAADTVGRINVTEENDYFFSHNDRHYTQGVRASYLSPAITPNDYWDGPYKFLADILPIFDGNSYKRKYDWTVLGQSIFTPQNTEVQKPGPKAWPYGAWLYTGAGLLQEDRYDDHHTLENFELLAGIVGPGAFGNVTQNDFHELIGVQPANGWQNQLHNEPGVVATYERKWRFQQPLIGHFMVDAIPESGVTLGNVFTYGEVGGMVRFGQNLGADYGPSHIRPSLSGTSWFDKTQLAQPLGWYVYAGTQGRAIARNIFLDGNSFQSSPSVDHRPLVADFLVGASLFWTDDIRLDVSAIQRTQEYFGQKGYDRFGSIDLAFVF